VGASVGADDYRQHDHALILRFACFFGIVGLGIIDGHRRTDAIANAIDAATIPTAITRSNPGAASGADAATGSTPDTAANAGSIRGWSHDLGEGITQIADLRQGDVWSRDDRWIDGQFGVHVTNDDRRRSQRQFARNPGKCALGSFEFVAVSATATATHGLGTHRHREIGADIRRNRRNLLLNQFLMRKRPVA
jgi:hypothetical protein